MFFIYLLESLENGSYYTGYTDNVTRRKTEYFISPLLEISERNLLSLYPSIKEGEQ
jgi:hypothetical protein